MYILNKIDKDKQEKRLIKIFKNRKEAEEYLENCLRLNSIRLTETTYELEKI